MSGSVAPIDPGVPCPSCDTSNRPGARFCKACGGSVRAPDRCPGCGSAIPPTARFCPSCGSKVVGARPSAPTGPIASEDRSPAEATSSSADDPPKSPETVAESGSLAPAESEGSADRSAPEDPPEASAEEAAAALDRLRAERARAKPAGVGTNLLFFVAVLMVFLAGTYAWNKDKPKEGSMFGGAPPGPAPDGMAPAAGGGPGFSGEVRLGAAVADRAPSGGVLFVVVRNAGMPDKGPPLAVKRIPNPRFPVAFEVGAGDVMMQGMPFLGPFDVYVRLDKDGNAMTKDPGDLSSSGPLGGVALGRTDVVVELARAVGDPSPAPGPAPAPAPATGTPPPAAATGGATIRGTIEIDPKLAAGAEGTVYVVLRPAGVPPMGPPVAVKRYTAPSFPLAFEVGPGDVMMAGSPFIGPFDVYVRLDRDGNAMTKQPGDLETAAPVGGRSPGDEPVVVRLDVRRE